jgi:WD40 repeat protein
MPSLIPSAIHVWLTDQCTDWLQSARLTRIANWQNYFCIPVSTRFCTAGGDKKLRCFSVDLKNNSTVQMLDGHESYINDCVFNPIQGDAIASVSGKYVII